MGPDLAIVSCHGSIPDGLDPQRTRVVTTSRSPAAAHPPLSADRVIVAGHDALDANVLTAAFATHGISTILCEGGPTLHAFPGVSP